MTLSPPALAGHDRLVKPGSVVCGCGAKWRRTIQPTAAEWAAIEAAWKQHRRDVLAAAVTTEPELMAGHGVTDPDPYPVPVAAPPCCDKGLPRGHDGRCWWWDVS